MSRRFAVSFALAAAACGDNYDPPEIETEPEIVARCTEPELEQFIRELPGVTSVRQADCQWVDGAKCFNIGFTQPIDHATPGATFTQQLWLAHRGCERPMLVADWGYSQDYFFDDELSVLFNTNTLWIEHRFQGASVPVTEDWDWSALTIDNGAHDMHKIISTFKGIYADRWVSTGASKGGITATYHNYFFRDDVDGTVPYVAPASRARVDLAYQPYLDTVLPEPCAQRIRDAQVAALTTRRPAMLAKLTTEVGPGSEEMYLEYMTAYFDWGFWQYRGERYCNRVPAQDVTDDAFWDFYKQYSGVFAQPGDERSDGALYYEWLTEHGFALQVGAHISTLMHDPFATMSMEDMFLEQYPDVVLPAYDGFVTRSVRHWVRERAENMLLVYGQYDPWSGGAMDEPTRPTSARYFVPRATHGAAISDLPAAERDAALALASTYFDEPAALTRMARAREAVSTREAVLAEKVRHPLLGMPR